MKICTKYKCFLWLSFNHLYDLTCADIKTDSKTQSYLVLQLTIV